MYYADTGDIYVGDWIDGKRSGRGTFYRASDQSIYLGEWTNDSRQGEGSILSSNGELASGDFRADQMEGKLTYQATLSAQETEHIFHMIKN